MRHLGLLSAVVAALVLSACGAKGDAELLASARAHLQADDPNSAIVELKALLDHTPASADGRLLFGAALLAVGDAAGAETELRRARELHAPEAAVAPPLAKAMLAQRRYRPLADEFAGIALADAQAQAEVQVTVAGAYAALDELQNASNAIDAALRLAPGSTPARVTQARILALGGDHDAALRVLRELLAADTTAAEGWRLQGDLLLFSKNDASAAVNAYKQALAISPKEAAFHVALINAYFTQRDAKSAARQFDALKAVQPEHPLTHYYEAQVAYARGDYSLTRELLQDLLGKAPNDPVLLHLAGVTELELESLAQAEVYLARALQLQPDFAAARKALARVFLRSSSPGRALAVLQPVLATADAEALTVAAQAQLRLGDAKAADELLARATALGAGEPAVKVALALAKLAKGNDAQATFGELQAIAAADEDIGPDLALIRARIVRNELDAALEAIDRLEKKQPANPMAADFRGRVQILRKDPAAARKAFEQAVGRDPRYFPAVASLAALDILERKPAAALARFQSLLKIDPRNVESLLAVADLKQKAGGTREEVAALIGQAVAANALHARPRLALIDFHLASHDLPAALAAAQDAVAALPGHAEIQDRHARVLWLAGDTHHASSSFAKLVAQSPDSYRGHLGFAELNLAQGDLDAAAHNARRAYQLAPEVLAVQRAAMAVAMRRNQPQDAIAIARRMQQQRPGDALAFILEGEIELSLKQWDPAIAALRKAVGQADPAQAPGLLHSALTQSQNVAEAARFAGNWLAQHPKDSLFRLYLGHTAMAQGQLALAESRFLEVLKDEPDNAVALNNAARVTIGQHKPGAVALAERALAVAPGQPQLIDTLALALASENQNPRAIELLKQLVAKAPAVPTFRLSLAKVYLQSGDKAQARTELAALLKLEADFPGRAEALQISKAIGAS
jgi:putative PEP-CTERM system TPR-repeat lipoprotein